jgi:hypothetical protein
MNRMNKKFLLKFLFQTSLISLIYFTIWALGLFKLDLRFTTTNLISITFIFVLSGFILFFRLPDKEPIAGRFLIMTAVQLISILFLELAYIYTNQSNDLILHGLFFSLVQFIFQTVFLVRIQKG